MTVRISVRISLSVVRNHIQFRAVFGEQVTQGMLRLDVKGHQCKRKVHYGLLGLIGKHGAMLALMKRAEKLSVDCPKRTARSYYRRCGVYFPDVKQSLQGVEKSVK